MAILSYSVVCRLITVVTEFFYFLFSCLIHLKSSMLLSVTFESLKMFDTFYLVVNEFSFFQWFREFHSVLNK